MTIGLPTFIADLVVGWASESATRSGSPGARDRIVSTGQSIKRPERHLHILRMRRRFRSLRQIAERSGSILSSDRSSLQFPTSQFPTRSQTHQHTSNERPETVNAVTNRMTDPSPDKSLTETDASPTTEDDCRARRFTHAVELAIDMTGLRPTARFYPFPAPPPLRPAATGAKPLPLP